MDEDEGTFVDPYTKRFTQKAFKKPFTKIYCSSTKCHHGIGMGEYTCAMVIFHSFSAGKGKK